VTVEKNVTNSQEWKDCLQYISRRLTDQSFNTWFKPTQGEPNSNGEFTIAVPNRFVADWIRSHFSELIEEAFIETLGRCFEVVYITSNCNGHKEQEALELYNNGNGGGQPLPGICPARSSGNLNLKYDFDSLVVGDFNQFACAAAMAVAEAPGLTNYNPLCIYGGTGLGKTHIAQAIGNSIMGAFSSKRVVYATSEKFTSDFISAISSRSIPDFYTLLSRCRHTYN